MRFALMLWNEGEYDGVRILKPETIRLMRQLEVESGVLEAFGIEGLGFGLGVSVVADEEKTVMPSRNGDFWWSGAYGTHFWVSPSTGIVLVVLQQNKMSDEGGTPIAPFLVQQLALTE
jgi:CubicO group peptidase (beta-lactamase class C family)